MEQKIQEIIQLLMQGKQPEELLQMGYTEEEIMQALQILEAKLKQQQGGDQQPKQGMDMMMDRGQQVQQQQQAVPSAFAQ